MPDNESWMEKIDRFWTKVDMKEPSECWNWLGRKDPHGYGRFGTRPTQWMGLAHRFAFIISGREFTRNQPYCRHMCNNSSCCNPFHLERGSKKENSDDMIRAGRHASQKKTHCSKGHELVPENLYYWDKKPHWRICKLCRKASA